MSSNQFWLGFWGILVSGLLALSILIASVMEVGHHKEMETLNQMVADGADPIRAACSLQMRAGWKDADAKLSCLLAISNF